MPALAATNFRDPYDRLRPTETAATPFRYVLAEDCLVPEIANGLLDWFDTDAPWSLARTDFYEQFEVDLRDCTLPEPLRSLIADEALAGLRRRMQEMLGDRLAPDVRIVAHRLEPGQRIAIHNDLREGGETHRLTIQLNHGLADEDGGLFMLFNSADPTDVHRILRPLPGSGIGFAIGANSNHAVSRVHGGTRFTLVYSFHAEPR